MQYAVTGSKFYQYPSASVAIKEGASFTALQPSGDNGNGFSAVEFALPFKDKDMFSQAPAMYDLEFDFVSAFKGIVPVLRTAKFIKTLNFEFLNSVPKASNV